MPFDRFYGNSQTVSVLRNMINSHHLPQALILEGDRGCGKRTLAKIIAQASVCTSENGRPCGYCPQCMKAENSSHPDIIVLEGGDSSRSFGIEKIRSLREDANILPNEAPVKVYLLFKAHNMTEQAQNAFLKILEEPPQSVRFILTCEAAKQLLPTVVSRCVVLPLSNVAENEAFEVLTKRFPKASAEDITAAVRIWNGNIGRAEESLSGGSFLRAYELADKFLSSLLEKDETAALRVSAPLCKDRELFRSVFGLLAMRLGDALHSSEGSFPYNLSHTQIVNLYSCVQECISGSERYANQPLLVTYSCAQLRNIIFE